MGGNARGTKGEIHKKELREHGATEKQNHKNHKNCLLGTCGERRNIPTRNPKVIHRIVYSGTALKRGNAGERALGTARGEAKQTHCVHNDEHHSDSNDKRHF